MAGDLTQRLERIALWLDGRSRQFAAEGKANGNDQEVYETVARDNRARADAIREAINLLKKRTR